MSRQEFPNGVVVERKDGYFHIYTETISQCKEINNLQLDQNPQFDMSSGLWKVKITKENCNKLTSWVKTNEKPNKNSVLPQSSTTTSSSTLSSTNNTTSSLLQQLNKNKHEEEDDKLSQLRPPMRPRRTQQILDKNELDDDNLSTTSLKFPTMNEHQSEFRRQGLKYNNNRDNMSEMSDTLSVSDFMTSNKFQYDEEDLSYENNNKKVPTQLNANPRARVLAKNTKNDYDNSPLLFEKVKSLESELRDIKKHLSSLNNNK